MPTYDYRCPANDRVVEVSHRMSENMATWGEICERLGMDAGDTPSDSPVVRLATGGNIVSSSSSGGGMEMPACNTGGCCGGGMCGIH